MRLEHKVAIVTGGGTGIGEAIAKVFAREGAKVAITGRRKDEWDPVAKDMDRKGGQALALPGSVTNEPDVREAVAATARESQGLSAFPLNVSDAALQLVLPPTGDRDLRAFSRKNLRNRFADARPATCHNRYLVFESHGCVLLCCRVLLSVTRRDRKSTRLNSSHVRISYA